MTCACKPVPISLNTQLVFDTAGGKNFTKMQAGLIVWGGFALGVGILYTAVAHQQKKHGKQVFVQAFLEWVEGEHATYGDGGYLDCLPPVSNHCADRVEALP